MRYHCALIRCARCAKWSGWISRTKGGVKAIDTVCSCCGKRLRYTEHRDTSRSKISAYHPGRGAHNRTNSVRGVLFQPKGTDVKAAAARLNKRSGKGGFKKAKDLISATEAKKRMSMSPDPLSHLRDK
jgi:hypothetical protein